MAIPSVGGVRFAPFEDALRRALREELTNGARVRRLFKHVELAGEGFGGNRGLLARSEQGDRTLGRIPSAGFPRVCFVRTMKPETELENVERAGVDLISDTLRAEDCELIDELARTRPRVVPVVPDSWSQLLNPGPSGGPIEDLTGRVLLVLRADHVNEGFLAEHCVDRYFASEAAMSHAAEHHPGTIGFLVAPEDDGVRFVVDHGFDWGLAHDGSIEGPGLVMTATWRVVVKAGAVVQVVQA